MYLKKKKVFKIKKAGSFLLSHDCSIIGARVLDFRVRNGNGYTHPAMATSILLTFQLILL